MVGTHWPDVILVNGPSSAGKTTLCRGLQEAIAHPYLCIGFDDFVFTAAERYYLGADTAEQSHQDRFTADGVRMVVTSAPDEPRAIDAVFGPVFRSLIDGMAPAVRALVDAGSSVIFDHVLHDREMYVSIRAASRASTCSRSASSVRWRSWRREASRGDRVLGRARGWLRSSTVLRVRRRRRHRHNDPRSCVDRVLEALASRS